jgi:hypothetical protein
MAITPASQSKQPSDGADGLARRPEGTAANRGSNQEALAGIDFRWTKP